MTSPILFQTKKRKPLIKRTDSYKFSHYPQYPEFIREVYSYLESRGGLFPYTVFFGLQYYLMEYLVNAAPTHEEIDEAKPRIIAHMGGDPVNFNEKGWREIADLGYLPLEIKAVPEGTVVPTSNVLMTVRNTIPGAYWLTNYIETLLVKTWYPTTVATQSREWARLIHKWCVLTGADPASAWVQDFGYRGVTSEEQAAIGGAAHLTQFIGTDTFAAIDFLYDYYGAQEMPGFSIPAAEHSTITSWGRDHEFDAFRNMLETYPTGMVAVVSDSYDIYKAVSDGWGKELKEAVLSRDGKLVIRPDSGYPPEVVVEVLERLGEAFGYTTNPKGFKTLHPKVGVIQGDGVNYEMINAVLQAMHAFKWAADNISFGSGGANLQKVDRDTQKFAFKCSNILIGDESRPVYKDPITDSGKRSKSGKLALVQTPDGSYQTLPEGMGVDVLQTVFLDGKITKTYTIDEIRARAKAD